MVKERGNEGKDEQQKKKGKLFEKQIRNAKTPHPHYICPRCDSNHTKFCYYNNYNVTQPRYFCKNCRRYWTQGGYQRNVPIGGGSRKISHDNNSSSMSNGEASSSSNISVTPQPIVRNLHGMVGLLSRSFGMSTGNQAGRNSSLAIIPSMNALYSYNRLIPYNFSTCMQNMYTTPPGENGFNNIFAPHDFNRPVAIRPQQGRFSPISGLDPPTGFTFNQIRMSNNNPPNIINQGKQPMFPENSINRGNSFEDMKNCGKELSYVHDPSINQTTSSAELWNQGISSRSDNFNLQSTSNNNYINNINHMSSSSSTFWTTCSGNNKNNTTTTNNDKNDNNHNNNNHVPKSFLYPKEWPNDFPNFDHP